MRPHLWIEDVMDLTSATRRRIKVGLFALFLLLCSIIYLGYSIAFSLKSNFVLFPHIKNEEMPTDAPCWEGNERLTSFEEAGKNGETAISVDFAKLWRQEEPANLSLCPEKPPGLEGRLQLNMTFLPPSLEQIELEYPELGMGGHWSPKDCRARHRVAVIIPFRDREEHLRGFLYHMHRFFQRQQLDYAIFVVEQFGHNLTFNKGRLMNAGVLEVMKLYPFDCVVFHDVDTIPENDFNMYTCPTNGNQTKHLGVVIDHLGEKLMYEAFIGGATILTEDQVRRANGYSNDFWGWGGEDDDFYARVNLAGMKFWRPSAEIGRYRTFGHKRDQGNTPNRCRFVMLKWTKTKQPIDGLNSVRYRILSMEFRKLYTHLMIDVLQSEYDKFQQYLKTLEGC